MKKLMVIHPLLFAVFPIVSLFSHNVTLASPTEIVRPVIIVASVALVLWLLLALVVKDKTKAAIIVSTFLFLFFSYGHFYGATRGWTVAGMVVGKHRYLVLLYAASLATVTYAAVTTRSDLRRLTAAVNIFAAFLVALPAGTAAYRIAVRPKAQISAQTQIKNTANLNQPEKRPDIYYIILDGYARADILKGLYQYDNSQFIDYLRQKGFYVANKSRSNYCQTCLSLASSLNFKYLDDIANQVGLESDDRRPLEEMIRDSAVGAFLRQHGYVFVAFSSGYGGTEIRGADMYLTPRLYLTEFENVLINTTPLAVVQERWLPQVQYNAHRQRALYIFDHLADMTEIDPPVFVFAHILAPHPPFVFDEHGEPIYPHRKFSLVDGSHFMEAGGNRAEYIQNYGRQLTFINQKIKQTVDRIMSNSRQSPIIILQGDHGPGSMLDWENPDNTNFRERLSNFNAYHLPDNGCQALYDEITPVNTFRLIFNHYFGANYKLLKDQAYFSTWDHPYKFIDVTDQTNTD